MTTVPCDREQAVVDAVVQGRWPAACDEDLRDHVAGCVSCAEAIEVTAMLSADLAREVRDARLPAAGQVWWRAAVRARLESAQAAARPVAWVQALAGACAAGAAAAVIAMAWPSIADFAGRAGSVATELDPRFALASPMFATLVQSVPVALGIAAVVILAPLAVLYFALSGD